MSDSRQTYAFNREVRRHPRFRPSIRCFVQLAIGKWQGTAEIVDVSLESALVAIPRSASQLFRNDSKPVVKFLDIPSFKQLRLGWVRYSDDQNIYIVLHWSASPTEIEQLLAGGESGELLYKAHDEIEPVRFTITEFDAELKHFLAKHPEKLYSLSPRRFEELVAAILADMGLDVELTKTTRDGGVDIYAYVRHKVASFLMLVECKRWAPDRPVGLDVVQRLYGVQQTKNASKSLIVTTSFFTDPARKESTLYSELMELKDYTDLKTWLADIWQDT